jgi:hypothetical protein
MSNGATWFHGCRASRAFAADAGLGWARGRIGVNRIAMR